MFAISSEGDFITKIGMTEYSIIAKIKNKLYRLNSIVQKTTCSEREYDMLLESYAKDIHDMCKKFYECNAKRGEQH